MKKPIFISLIEFTKILKKLRVGDTILIRYIAHDVDEYIDIMGEVFIRNKTHKVIYLGNATIIQEKQIDDGDIDLTVNNCEINGEQMVYAHYTNIASIIPNYDRFLKLGKIRKRIKELSL